MCVLPFTFPQPDCKRERYLTAYESCKDCSDYKYVVTGWGTGIICPKWSSMKDREAIAEN